MSLICTKLSPWKLELKVLSVLVPYLSSDVFVSTLVCLQMARIELGYKQSVSLNYSSLYLYENL